MATEETMTLKQILAERTREGTLYKKLANDWVHCYACGHNCKIPPGRDGVCRVRFNDGGTLRVPWGYVGGVQLDPVEKKPFFHAFPGALAMSFGMLGCDFHCSYCFAPTTRIATSEGLMRIDSLFAEGETEWSKGSEEIRRPMREVRVYTHTGQLHGVSKLFRHPYKGKMMRVRPWYLPPLECTPEHEFLVIDAPPSSNPPPHFVRAEHLTPDHLLAVPKHFSFSHPVVFNTAELLQPLVKPYKAKRTIGREALEEVMRLSAEGLSSREIGARVGKEASRMRHLRSKLNRGDWDLERLGEVNAPLTVEAGGVRLPKEHQPGIPHLLALDVPLAKLLGYYCAEGCVSRSKDRVHAATLNFSFGHHEEGLANEVIELLGDVFNVHAYKVYRDTTIGVAVDKASVALCFESLCGHRARAKRVPPTLYQAPREVAESFLRAYAAGDGSLYANGLTQIGTVSEELAYGVAGLVLKLGLLPSISSRCLPNNLIMGRQVNSAPYFYNVNWYFHQPRRKFAWEDENYWYIRLRAVDTFDYDDDVYNLEVEGDHSYIANLIATHNCQNWVTSQALRDPVAGAPPKNISPEEFASLARQYKAKIVTSTYNEPLITSEWGIEIFKVARRYGLVTSYVSNGNGTPEVLDYLRPHVDLYKVDLKGFNDRNYRKLGGVLKNTLDTIKMLYEQHFWLEIVTLIVPGFNDSDAELKDIADFLVSISPDIPWHVTAFHQDYKMTDPDNTSVSTLIRAAEIGYHVGLHYVYAGNLPGHVGRYENTYCPNCNELLVERWGFKVLRNRVRDGGCPKCKTTIPGVWSERKLETMRAVKLANEQIRK